MKTENSGNAGYTIYPKPKTRQLMPCFFIFIVAAPGLHLASADAVEFRVETVPHRWLSLARKDRGVRRQSTLCRGGPSFDSVSPLKPSERVNCKPALCLPFSRRFRFTVHPAEAGAFLIRAGATRHTVPPHFPTGIGFDPCIASMRPSKGREGHLTAATPTD